MVKSSFATQLGWQIQCTRLGRDESGQPLTYPRTARPSRSAEQVSFQYAPPHSVGAFTLSGRHILPRYASSLASSSTSSILSAPI